MPAFARYVGIDYSGAQTPTASLRGLRVYLAEGGVVPAEVAPPPSSRKYWTRRGVAEWLVVSASLFRGARPRPDWPAFLDDFQRHWPTDADHTYVDFVRDGSAGNGAARMGNARWRRLTEERAGGAKSVFHFDVPGQVTRCQLAYHNVLYEALKRSSKRPLIGPQCPVHPQLRTVQGRPQNGELWPEAAI